MRNARLKSRAGMLQSGACTLLERRQKIALAREYLFVDWLVSAFLLEENDALNDEGEGIDLLEKGLGCTLPE
jgi:hypothetical protein